MAQVAPKCHFLDATVTDKSNYLALEPSFPFDFPRFCSILAFQTAHQRCFDNSQLFCLCVVVVVGGCVSILGDVSKIYKQYTLVRQDDFPLGAVVCLDGVVIVILILSHYAFLCLPPPPPIAVAGVSEAYEDAANCLWLLSNSKSCANCKSPIQKNEGCNHMQCAKVKSGWEVSHACLDAAGSVSQWLKDGELSN